MKRVSLMILLAAGLSTTMFGQHLISPFDGRDSVGAEVRHSHGVTLPARWFCPYHQRAHEVVFVEVSCPLGDEHCTMRHFGMLCTEGNRGTRLFAEVTMDVSSVCKSRFPMKSVRYVELAINKPQNGVMVYEEISDVMRINPDSKYDPSEWSAGKFEYVVTTKEK